MTTKRQQENTKNATNLRMNKLGAEGRRFAKWLDKTKFTYVMFSFTDGLNMASSLDNLIFTLRYFDTNFFPNDQLHEWLSTPEGIALAAVETVFITAASMLASIYSEKDENVFKASIAILWPYLRTTFKGLKNAFKGVRSTILALDMLSGRDMRNLILPVGLFIGVLSAANRVCMRKFVEQPRKDAIIELSKILQEIQSTKLHFLSALPTNEMWINYKNSYVFVDGKLYFVGEFDEIKSDKVVKTIRFDEVSVQNSKALLFDLNLLREDIDNDDETPVYLTSQQVHKLITSNGGHVPPAFGLDAQTVEAFRERMQQQEQSPAVRRYGLVGAAYGGIIDGLYLFMSAMGLAALSSPVFVLLTSFSVIYAITCIASRIFEEQDFQRQLDAKHAEVELAICGKELELLLTELQRLSSPLHWPMHEDARTVLQKEYVDRITQKMKEFTKKRETLSSLSLLSDTAVVFAGLRNGLTVYNTVMSLMFAVAAINAMIGALFPPAFLIACVSSGLVCLIGCVAYALRQHVELKKEHKEKAFDPDSKLNEILEAIKKNINAAKKLKPMDIKEGVIYGTSVVRSPTYDIPILAEAGRSFFAGISKGTTTLNTLGGAWQVPDANGHYHDTPLMQSLALANASFYAGAMFLKAIGKGWGKPDLTCVDEDEAVNRDTFHIEEDQILNDEELMNFILSELEQNNDLGNNFASNLSKECNDPDEQNLQEGVPTMQHPPSMIPADVSFPNASIPPTPTSAPPQTTSSRCAFNLGLFGLFTKSEESEGARPRSNSYSVSSIEFNP